MSKFDKHDEFGDGDIGGEVEKFLRDTHGTEEEEPSPKSKRVPQDGSKISVDDVDIAYSPEYEEVKIALEKVFAMCDRHGFSIQVALADEPLNVDGERGNRITICGHMTPNSIPCEMVAAAAVYQAHHLFSHMVLAMASAGAPLINPIDSEEDEEDGKSS